MNQDGRSASITAPSGPAQTACVKASLKEAGLTPDQCSFSECHGTGTQLGDPIEVGSTRIVQESYTRYPPLILGAAKTQVGHLELGAGSVGMMRTISVLRYATAPCNGHIRQLNEHFGLDGFPLILPCEAIDMGTKCLFVGVSSFGFGGTNCRADLWGKAARGYLAPKPDNLDSLAYITVQCPKCLGPMCHRCGVAIQTTASMMGKHYCATIRKEFETYDYCSLCYDGGYYLEGPSYQDWANQGERIYMIGTWNAWSEFEEMERNEDDGTYTAAIRLGETRREEFRLTVGTNRGSRPKLAKNDSIYTHVFYHQHLHGEQIPGHDSQ